MIAFAEESEDDYISKISSELLDKLNSSDKNDYISVHIWLKDIDHSEVLDEVKAETGISKETISNLSKQMKSVGDSALMTQRFVPTIGNEIEGIDQIEYYAATDSIRKELNKKVNTYIASERKISREKYNEQNDDALNSLDITDDNIIFKSQYSPMIIANLTVNEILEIAHDDAVVSLSEYVEEEASCAVETDNTSVEASVTADSFSTEMAFHKAAIGMNYLPTTYNGTGVKIGQIEPGTIDKSYSLLANSDIEIVRSVATYEKDPLHAARVASIMVGSGGIAPNAELYSISMSSNGYSYYSNVEALIDKGVSVINMSAGFYSEPDNYYGTREKWMDYIVYKYNIAFVKSAGNSSSWSPTSYMVSGPGLAYNVITVGAINDQLTLDTSDDVMYDQSCYENGDSNGCAKPDFVAPGENFFDGGAGTSYAAPMVTGAIACMMQEDPSLKTNPYAVKAILTASCDRKVEGESYSASTTGLTEKQGAGVINAYRAIKIISGGTYKSGAAYDTSTTQNFISSSGQSRFSLALTWNKYTVVTSSSDTTEPFTFKEYPITNLNLAAYGQKDLTSYFFMGSSSVSNSSTELVNCSRQAANDNVYRAVIFKPTANEYPPQYAIAWY